MNKPVIAELPKSLDECNTDGERMDWLKLRVLALEKECDAYRKDPLYSTYFAEARKAAEIAESLNSFVLSVTDDGTTLKNYALLTKLRPQQLDVLNKLRTEYLKVDEETLAEIEKSGVPLIERRVVVNGKQSKKAR
jgi:hypothetical protein